MIARVSKFVRKTFSILAVIAGLLLMTGFVSAVVAPGPGRIPLAKVAGVATVVIYATSSVFVGLIGKRVAKIAARLELPDWVGAQAEKNQRKVWMYWQFGAPMALLAVWSDVLLGRGPFYLGLQALNLSFQLGALLGMSVVVGAQERLLQDVRVQAATLRPVVEF